MERRRLGNTNEFLGKLGVGCWAFGGGSYWGKQSQVDVNNVVVKALDLGINYFDTAEVYNDGASESSLGIALKGKRDKAFIGTKVSPSNTNHDVLKKHCENSLARLNTDYIDLYMIHWPINELSIRHFTGDESIVNQVPSVDDAFAVLEELKHEGKIRFIGVSNFGIKQLNEALNKEAKIVANELPYNLFSRAIEKNILPFCEEKNVSILGYMALQQGLLTGLYKSPEEVPAMQAHSRHFYHDRGQGASRHGENGAEKEIFEALEQIQEIADNLGVHIAQLSLAWAMSKKAITCTLVGSRNIRELEMNVEAASYTLHEDIKDALEQITNPVLDKLGYNPDYYENRCNSRIE